MILHWVWVLMVYTHTAQLSAETPWREKVSEPQCLLFTCVDLWAAELPQHLGLRKVRTAGELCIAVVLLLARVQKTTDLFSSAVQDTTCIYVSMGVCGVDVQYISHSELSYASLPSCVWQNLRCAYSWCCLWTSCFMALKCFMLLCECKCASALSPHSCSIAHGLNCLFAPWLMSQACVTSSHTSSAVTVQR